MLSLSDGIPARRSPIVNVLLIAANFVVFIFYELPHLNAAVYHASFYPCSVEAACRTPEPWGLSWITAMFLHGGWDHILGNMLFSAVTLTPRSRPTQPILEAEHLRQWTSTDGRGKSAARCGRVAEWGNWLRDEEADASPANRDQARLADLRQRRRPRPVGGAVNHRLGDRPGPGWGTGPGRRPACGLVLSRSRLVLGGPGGGPGRGWSCGPVTVRSACCGVSVAAQHVGQRGRHGQDQDRQAGHEGG